MMASNQLGAQLELNIKVDNKKNLCIILFFLFYIELVR